MVGRVGVVIPNFNHAAFLRQRLEAVYNQTYQDFVVVLIDDFSTDESVEILNEYENHQKTRKLILNESNSGNPFLQWKIGISFLSDVELIWIAESDDYCELDFLEKLVREIDLGADVAYCKSIIINEANEPRIDQMRWYRDLGEKRWEESHSNDCADELKTYLSLKCTIPNASAVVFKKSLIPKGLLDYIIEHYRKTGDWFFWIRVMESAKGISYITQSTNYFRSHKGTTRSGRDFSRNKEIERTLRYVLSLKEKTHSSANLVKYYFRNHLYVHPRRSMKNVPILIRQSLISVSFLKVWFRYFLTNSKETDPKRSI